VLWPEVLEVELRLPENDLKWDHIFILGLTWPSEPILVEVDGNLYYFDGVIQPLFCSLAQNKWNNDQN
jgi:hypothetical protein